MLSYGNGAMAMLPGINAHISQPRYPCLVQQLPCSYFSETSILRFVLFDHDSVWLGCKLLVKLVPQTHPSGRSRQPEPRVPFLERMHC